LRAIHSNSARPACKSTPRKSHRGFGHLELETRAQRIEALKAMLSAPAWDLAVARLLSHPGASTKALADQSGGPRS